MQPCDFLEFHGPALETNEARHNIILAILARAVSDPDPNVRLWTLGTPGQCAVQTPGRPIVLGDLDQAQVILLAETTVDLDYPGVVGPDLTAKHFADRASTLGIDFLAPIPQRVHALSGAPRYPGAPGQARAVDAEDAALFADWMIAFTREAVPHDRLPEGERLAHAAREGQHLLWVVDGEPVSMAGIVRRTRHTAAIAAVYTPPSSAPARLCRIGHRRGRGARVRAGQAHGLPLHRSAQSVFQPLLRQNRIRAGVRLVALSARRDDTPFGAMTADSIQPVPT